MTAARAADSDIHVTAALSFEERDKEFKEAFQLPDECHGIGIGQHIGSHPRIFTSQWFEVGDKKRVSQKPDVKQEIDVVWHAELETEGYQRDGQPLGGAFLPELPDQQLSQLMHCQIRGIDDTVGVAPEISETLFFKSHSLQYRKLRQQRMGSPRLRESANQDLFARFKKYELDLVTESLHPLENPHKIGKEYALPDIDAKRDVFDFSSLLMTELDKGRQKGRRQIIYTEVSAIFKTLQGMRLP
jgi:hypothetical protein